MADDSSKETPERPRFTPTCLKACRQTYSVIIGEWLNYVPVKMWQNQKVFKFNMHKTWAKPLSISLLACSLPAKKHRVTQTRKSFHASLQACTYFFKCIAVFLPLRHLFHISNFIYKAVFIQKNIFSI